ncbi:MAG TPA: putative hydro-lyase [Actinophytocola sp.]|uniref:putative hydro-lyase n=1 Tax=Actinophytocola sp. TaxID=1872138 RepID=UPI002DBE007F|nr:putative hydro-lyase [Actinophytocola sp.]HEU5473289.1 putative hydro-lyase [Actinophytocola sp.]
MSTASTARAAFRDGVVASTAGWAPGFVQANLVSVPTEDAYDMLLFAQRNPKPCPVLDVTDPGSPATVLAPDADLRTDLPRYRVWRHGQLDEEPDRVTHVWRDDLITFLIGCSFTFEAALAEAGVPLRHVDAGRNVPMYVTNRDCRPAGRFSGPLVVSMRPVPAGQVATAVRVSAQVPQVHGAPVHIGAPEELGIADLARPDFGEPVDPLPGDVPVFWACGVTPQAVLLESKIPFAITHAPGYMFITDVRDIAYRTAG